MIFCTKFYFIFYQTLSLKMCKGPTLNYVTLKGFKFRVKCGRIDGAFIKIIKNLFCYKYLKMAHQMLSCNYLCYYTY